jgi:hypothetical protein
MLSNSSENGDRDPDRMKLEVHMLTVSRMTAVFTFTVVALVVAHPSPAFAINGRDAVNVCIDSTASGARCEWSVNKKGEVDICNKSGCVTCPSATGECTTASKTRPRPTTTLPAGTTVMTEVGTFKVTPRAHNGPILKATVEENGNK